MCFSANRLLLLYVLTILALNFKAMALNYGNVEEADKDYEKALVSYENDDVKSAVIHLKNTFKANQDHLPGRILYAQMLLAHNSGEAAMVELEHAKSLGADLNLLLPLQMEALLHQQKFTEAVKLASAGNSTNETETALAYFRGQANLGLGKLIFAEESFDQVLKSSPNHSLAKLGKAQVFIARKQYTQAAELLENILAGYDVPESARVLRAKLYMIADEPDNAIELLNQAISLNPDLLSARLARAQFSLARKKHLAAEKDINYLLDRAPKEPQANYLKALIDTRKGETALVEETYNKTLDTLTLVSKELHEENPQYLFLSGYLQFRKQQFALALESLDKYLEKVSDIRAVLLIAQIHFMQEDYASAENILARAKIERPLHNGVLILLGKTHLQLGNFSEAQKNLIASLAIDNTNHHILLDLAETFVRNAEYNNAQVALQEVAKHFPSLPRLLLLQNQNYLSLQQFLQALAITETLVNFHQNVAQFHYLHGMNQVRLQRAAQARVSFERAISLNAAHIESHVAISRLEVSSGNSDLAKQQLATLLESYPNTPQIMLALARIHRLNREPQASIDWLNKVISIDSTNIEAFNMLTQFYRENDELKKAEALLETTLKRSKSNEIRKLLADIYIEQRDFKQAIKQFTLYAEYAPKRGEALLLLANSYLLANNHDNAIATVEKALIWDENLIEARVMLIKLLLAQKETIRATDNIDILARDNRAKTLTLLLKGDLHFVDKNYHLAKSKYQQAFELAPSEKALHSLYRTYKKLNQIQEAENMLSAWVAEHGKVKNLTTLIALADTYQLNGKDDQAIGLYEEALQRFPNSVPVLNNLANAQLDQGETQQALALAKKANELAPDNVTVLDSLAWINYHLNEFETALRLLRKALAIDSNNLTVKYHLAATLHRLNRPKSAKKYLIDILNSSAEFSYRSEAEALIKRL